MSELWEKTGVQTDRHVESIQTPHRIPQIAYLGTEPSTP